MSTSVATASRSRIDEVFGEFLRIVMTDGWTPKEAADHLRRQVDDDPRVLRLLLARVAKATLERPTRVGRRAEVALHLALPDASPPATGARRPRGRRSRPQGDE